MRDDRHFEQQARAFLARMERARRIRNALYAAAVILFGAAFIAGLVR